MISVWHLDDRAALSHPSYLGVKIGMVVDQPEAMAALGELWAAGAYRQVALAQTMDPEQAYAWTNHVESDWTEAPRAGALVADARSSCVGDLFVFEDQAALVCAGSGFLPVCLPPLAPLAKRLRLK